MKTVFLSLASLLFAFTLHAQDATTVAPPVVKTRIIQTDFFAPITGNLSFGYQQSLMNSVTIDATLGIIGIGVITDNLHPAGIFVKGGPRLYFSPDYIIDGMKRYNDFQGAYFKPELVFSGFGFDYTGYNGNNAATYRGTNTSVGVMLNLGKQWVLAKAVSINLYGGIGYGWSSVKAPNYGYPYYGYNDYLFLPYKYSHLQVDNSIPLTLEAGFDIGILVK